MRDGRGLKPFSAHGPRAQERRNRRGTGGAKGRRGEKEWDSGELVSTSSSRSDNDGAVLPSYSPGKFLSSPEHNLLN